MLGRLKISLILGADQSSDGRILGICRPAAVAYNVCTESIAERAAALVGDVKHLQRHLKLIAKRVGDGTF